MVGRQPTRSCLSCRSYRALFYTISLGWEVFVAYLNQGRFSRAQSCPETQTSQLCFPTPDVEGIYKSFPLPKASPCVCDLVESPCNRVDTTSLRCDRRTTSGMDGSDTNDLSMLKHWTGAPIIRLRQPRTWDSWFAPTGQLNFPLCENGASWNIKSQWR